MPIRGCQPVVAVVVVATLDLRDWPDAAFYSQSGVLIKNSKKRRK